MAHHPFETRDRTGIDSRGTGWIQVLTPAEQAGFRAAEQRLDEDFNGEEPPVISSADVPEKLKVLHNPNDLLRLASRLENDADVAIGSRYVRGVNVVNWPLGRLLMSYFASKYVKIVTGMPVCDATAGFVGYRADVLRKINLDRVQMVGYGFQIEMKYTAWKHGFNVVEESIIFVDREAGTSKMSSGIFGEAFFGVLKLPFRNVTK